MDFLVGVDIEWAPIILGYFEFERVEMECYQLWMSMFAATMHAWSSKAKTEPAVRKLQKRIESVFANRDCRIGSRMVNRSI